MVFGGGGGNERRYRDLGSTVVSEIVGVAERPTDTIGNSEDVRVGFVVVVMLCHGG